MAMAVVRALREKTRQHSVPVALGTPNESEAVAPRCARSELQPRHGGRTPRRTVVARSYKTADLANRRLPPSVKVLGADIRVRRGCCKNRHFHFEDLVRDWAALVCIACITPTEPRLGRRKAARFARS